MKRYIGIDVSKARLDVAVHESAQCFSCDNTEAGVEALIKQKKELGPELIVMEATGGYERLCAALLAAAGLALSEVNPRQVRDFAKSKGILAKTDRLCGERVCYLVPCALRGCLPRAASSQSLVTTRQRTAPWERKNESPANSGARAPASWASSMRLRSSPPA